MHVKWLQKLESLGYGKARIKVNPTHNPDKAVEVVIENWISGHIFSATYCHEGCTKKKMLKVLSMSGDFPYLEAFKDFEKGVVIHLTDLHDRYIKAVMFINNGL